MAIRENDRTVTFHHVVCKRETDAAILVEIDEKAHWIPKSQIHPDSEVSTEEDSGDLIVSEWIATQKGLT